jgi:hypothetical protein
MRLTAYPPRQIARSAGGTQAAREADGWRRGWQR